MRTDRPTIRERTDRWAPLFYDHSSVLNWLVSCSTTRQVNHPERRDRLALFDEASMASRSATRVVFNWLVSQIRGPDRRAMHERKDGWALFDEAALLSRSTEVTQRQSKSDGLGEDHAKRQTAKDSNRLPFYWQERDKTTRPSTEVTQRRYKSDSLGEDHARRETAKDVFLFLFIDKT